mgnify:CR=1 FL=1
MIEINHLVKKYGSHVAVDDLSLTVEPGKIYGFLGPNGAGKSTLMKILMGIYKQDSGDVYFEGKQLSGQNPQKSLELGIAMIHQELNLVDQLSIAQNVFLGREIKKKNGLIDFKEMNRRVQKVMEGLKERTPVTTAVGNLKVAQKQLVEIARAISFDCKLIVMDEPTAMLDPHGRKSVIETAKKLNKEEGITVILITHYMEEVIEADRIFVMDDGKLVMEGTPKEVFSKVEKLKELRLDVPQATLVAHELQQRGIPLPDGILNNEELVDELCRLKSKM